MILAAIAGASFGAMTVAVRRGLARCAHPEVGAFAATVWGVVVSALATTLSAGNRGIHMGELWPFVAGGVIAPGASQILLTSAVRNAGSSRAAIFMGTAPLLSVLMAWSLLGERFRLLLLIGALLIVLGSVALARERVRPEYFRVRGVVLAIVCAGLFASRDTLLGWASRGDHPPALAAATASLLSATVLILLYLVVARRGRLITNLPKVMPAFAPAGVALALAYAALLAAFDLGRVSVVSPLNATGSLWAVLLSALLYGRGERIGRHAIAGVFLVVAGGALIGWAR